MASFIFDTHNKAAKFLSDILEVATLHNVATYADAKDFIGIESTCSYDEKIGWRMNDLTKARIQSISNGKYEVILPSLMKLDNSETKKSYMTANAYRADKTITFNVCLNAVTDVDKVTNMINKITSMHPDYDVSVNIG